MPVLESQPSAVQGSPSSTFTGKWNGVPENESHPSTVQTFPSSIVAVTVVVADEEQPLLDTVTV